MRKKFIKYGVAAVLAVVLGGIVFTGKNVNAVQSQAELEKLILITDIQKSCYAYLEDSVAYGSTGINAYVSNSSDKFPSLIGYNKNTDKLKQKCRKIFKSAAEKFGVSNNSINGSNFGYEVKNNKWVSNVAKQTSAVRFTNSLTGGATVAGVAPTAGGRYNWDNDAKYSLYYNYLLNYNDSGTIVQGNCGSSKPSGYSYYFKKSKSEWCGLEVQSSFDPSKIYVTAVKDNAMVTRSMKTVLTWLSNGNNYTGIAESTFPNSNMANMSAEGDDGEAEISSSEACYQSGVTSQSWFLCPTMENMSVFADGIDSMISDWLTVDTNLYDGSSKTYTIWEIMRNIANIALVLVLLAVIFSQLTGWGIDNYGIKKILPRLIAMAIVVNLSFIACQLVIDVSNILGESLHNMFASIGVELAGGEEHLNGFVPGMIAAILGAVTGAGVIGSIGITIGTTIAGGFGPMAVILIVMALLSIVIAVLMFFLMLGARMVLVVLCTAVAPVVAVLYILPNTQNWAKKWWKVFWAMLVMYPICGAVLGISTLIKGMVVQGGTVEIWMAVVGMVGPFLPFFMLPSMLRSAISMLGSVGAALVNAGQSVRKGAGDLANTIQNTDAAKNQMQMGRANLNRRLAGLDKNDNPTRFGQWRISRAQKNPNRARMLNMRAEMARKNTSEMEAAGAAMANAAAAAGIPTARAFMGEGDEVVFGDKTREAYYANQFAAAAEAGDTTAMNAALIAARDGGMRAKDIAKMVRTQVNKENGIGLSANSKAAWMRNLAASQNGAFLSKDFELKHFMQNGGMRGGQDISLGDYGAYAAAAPIKPEDLNPEDISALSGSSMAGMIASGAITAGMAQAVLASNPNISEDKRIMLNAVASGAIDREKIESKFRSGEYGMQAPSAYSEIGKEIKNDIDSIMVDHGATTTWIGGEKVDRDNWAKTAPQRVEVVGGGQVQQPQSGGGVLLTEGDSVKIHGRGGNSSAQGVWTPEATNQAQQEWQQSQPGMQGRDGWSANSRDQAHREWEDSQK